MYACARRRPTPEAGCTRHNLLLNVQRVAATSWPADGFHAWAVGTACDGPGQTHACASARPPQFDAKRSD
eukprot:359347-Chlamydomonas_euryale.AAC.5